MRFVRSPIARELLLALATGILAMILALLALHITPADLGLRWTTGSDDQILHYMVTTSATESWLYLPNDLLGFPADQNLFFAPIFDPASALELGVLSLFLRKGLLLLNVFYTLSFFLVGVTSYLAFRIFRVRIATSVVAALVFSLAPYHFLRVAMGHGFVANIWAIPLVVVALAMVCTLDTPLERWAAAGKTRLAILRRRLGVIVLVTLPLSLTLNYYYVFAVLLLLGILIFRFIANALSGRRSSEIVWPALAVGILIAFVIAQLAILSLNFGDRYANYFAARSFGDSELYGGKLTSLLFPWIGSNVPIIGQMAREYQSRSGLLPTTEPPGTPLIASLCMMLMIVFVLVRSLSVRTKGTKGIFSDERLGAVSAAFIWGFLFFLAGGLGTIFAGLVSGNIRAWGRISIILIMLALVFGAVLFDLLLTRLAWRTVGIVVLLAILAVDQLTGVASTIPVKPTKDTALRAFVDAVDADLPNGCGVVELPLKSFPESGAINRLQDYDLLLPYLYSDANLKWSYGSIRGTKAGNYWSDVTTKVQFAKKVKASGACAIIVDRFGYANDATWRSLVASVTGTQAEERSTESAHRYLMFEINP